MQVPIRKPGTYTHAKPDFHITQKKLDEIKAKLERLKKTHPKAVKEMQLMAELGDFSENAGYQIAKARLRGMNQKIEELETYVSHAVLIKPGEHTDTVQLGSTVTVEVGGKMKTYTILGSQETNPQQGIISSSSPIGSVLMGHAAGESVRLKIAGEDAECRILTIE